MKILIINGSHRAGNTDIMVNKVKEALPQEIFVREVKLREIDMKLPDGCEACGESEICPNLQDPFAKEIEPTIRDFEVYIIASPTWDDGVTPLTKIFWDRIVSWCHKDRMYLKDKKLAVITHGMAGEKSWDNVISWVKSVCTWEKSQFGGSLTLSSGSKVGEVKIDEEKIKEFVRSLLS